MPPRSQAIGVLIALVMTAGCGQLDPDVTAPATAQLGKQWQVVDEYCVECHNDIELAGGFAFDAMAAGTLAANAEVCEKAMRKLRGRLMPPPNRPATKRGDVALVRRPVESTLDEAASANPSYEARRASHRLNRKEYANAIHDLLALEIDPVELLPQDEVARGLRQHRERAAGVAVVRRAVRDRSAPRGAASRRAARRTRGQQDLHRRSRHSALARRGPAARHARRRARRALFPVRRRTTR